MKCPWIINSQVRKVKVSDAEEQFTTVKDFGVCQKDLCPFYNCATYPKPMCMRVKENP